MELTAERSWYISSSLKLTHLKGTAQMYWWKKKKICDDKANNNNKIKKESNAECEKRSNKKFKRIRSKVKKIKNHRSMMASSSSLASTFFTRHSAARRRNSSLLETNYDRTSCFLSVLVFRLVWRRPCLSVCTAEGEPPRQEDRQTHGQTDRRLVKQADVQTDRQTNKRKKKAKIWTDRSSLHQKEIQRE